MNVKLVIAGLTFSLLLIGSTSGFGQKSQDQVILQDDKTGDHLVFFLSSGAYKFQGCTENASTSGIGKVTVDGCKVSLNDISDTKRVLAEVDICAKVGKADVVFRQTFMSNSDASHDIEAAVSDRDIRDSVFDCTVKDAIDK